MFQHHPRLRLPFLRALATAWLLAALVLAPAPAAHAQDPVTEPPQPIQDPTQAPVETPVETPADTPADTPVDTPATTPADTPVDAPVDTPATTPADGSADLSADPSADPSADKSAEAPAAAPTQPAPAEPVTLTGQVAVMWGDLVSPDKRVLQSTVAASLLTDAGDVLPLALDGQVLQQAGGWPALRNATVQVSGSLDAAGQLQVASLSTLPAATPATQSPDDATLNDATPAADGTIVADAAVTGSRPWVLLLCKGAGSAIVHPSPEPYYNALLGDDAYGMGHFWREQSYGKANVLGSRSLGWLDLGKPAAAYQVSYAGGLSIDQESTFNDCTKAADAQIDFNKYTGVGIFMPLPSTTGYGVWFWGGTHVIRLDGKTRLISTVWMPMEIGETSDSNATDVNVLAHEMGHGFGLPHSSGPYGEVYDSTWDLMSGSGGARCNKSAPFGCAGQHTIAVHKEWLGWLNANQVVTLADKSTDDVLLERLAQPTGKGDLLIKVPIGATGRYYTVEARQLVGYDTALVAAAVIIHEVDEQRDEAPAQVVDPDGNGDVNDAGAQWLPGERFAGAGGVTICVKNPTLEGFRVAVGRNAQPNCTASADLLSSGITINNTLPKPGQVVPISITLVNTGAPAANVTVTSTLPAATSVVSGTVKAYGGTVKSVSANRVVFGVSSLTYDTPVVLSYSVTVSNALTLPTVINIPAAVTWNQEARPLSLSAQMVTNPVRLHIPRVSK